jgi:division protein CdvB (Snf7/Vps24/ESCRT-III family)
MYQTGNILNAVTNGTAQTIAASTANAANAITAIKDGNASLIREFGTVESALTALSGKMQECCCSTNMAIMQNNYDGAMRDAATNANFTAQIQSVKDLIQQNKIEALQAQVSALQLQNATANVIRFPNSYAFNGGVFPPVTTTPAA